MPVAVGQIEAIYRYPVKSMRGERLDAADLGWHGLAGDRRFALRKIEDQGGFPWLTASTMAELVLFTPHREDAAAPSTAPSHVRTPDGTLLPIFSKDLAADIERRTGIPVQMMQLKNGIFDDASVSVITLDTVREIATHAGNAPDVRRFRPNLIVRPLRSAPFQEDEWIGGTLSFGDDDGAPGVAVTLHDLRCSMVNIDPDSATLAPGMLKTVARMHDCNAGVYGTVTRAGRLAVGQTMYLHR